MDLKEWLYQNRITQVRFASMLEVDKNHLYSYTNKRVRISKKLARKIEQFTKCQVSYESLLANNCQKKKILTDKSA